MSVERLAEMMTGATASVCMPELVVIRCFIARNHCRKFKQIISIQHVGADRCVCPNAQSQNLKDAILIIRTNTSVRPYKKLEYYFVLNIIRLFL